MANQRWMRRPFRHSDIPRGGLHQHGTRYGRERGEAGADCSDESTVADIFTPPHHPQRVGLQCQQIRISHATDFALFLDASVGHTAVAEISGNVPRHNPTHDSLFVFLGRSVPPAGSSSKVGIRRRPWSTPPIVSFNPLKHDSSFQKRNGDLMVFATER